jgi:hypothetical protein
LRFHFIQEERILQSTGILIPSLIEGLFLLNFKPIKPQVLGGELFLHPYLHLACLFPEQPVFHRLLRVFRLLGLSAQD